MDDRTAEKCGAAQRVQRASFGEETRRLIVRLRNKAGRGGQDFSRRGR